MVAFLLFKSVRSVPFQNKSCSSDNKYKILIISALNNVFLVEFFPHWSPNNPNNHENHTMYLETLK